jgi:cytidylate kinase
VCADDAIVIDSTGLTVNDVFARMMSAVNKTLKSKQLGGQSAD